MWHPTVSEKKLIVEDKTKVQLIQYNLAQLTNRKYPCLTSASSNVYACIPRLLKHSKESQTKILRQLKKIRKLNQQRIWRGFPSTFRKKGKLFYISLLATAADSLSGGVTQSHNLFPRLSLPSATVKCSRTGSETPNFTEIGFETKCLDCLSLSFNNILRTLISKY